MLNSYLSKFDRYLYQSKQPVVNLPGLNSEIVTENRMEIKRGKNPDSVETKKSKFKTNAYPATKKN